MSSARVGAQVSSWKCNAESGTILCRALETSNVNFNALAFATPESNCHYASANWDCAIYATIDQGYLDEEGTYIEIDVEGDWNLEDLLVDLHPYLQTSLKVNFD